MLTFLLIVACYAAGLVVHHLAPSGPRQPNLYQPPSPRRAEDVAVLDRLAEAETSLTAQTLPTRDRPIEPCPDILARTVGKQPVTDDNMGTEWRHFLGLD